MCWAYIYISDLIQVAENRFGFVFWLCRGLLSVVLKLIFFWRGFVTGVFVVNKVNLIYIKLKISF